jgi:hypothetical protein
MLTPWGASQTITKIEEGLLSVTTASHGGFLVSRKWAENNLTPEAIEEGEAFGLFLAYEEDCAWAVIAFEYPGAMIPVTGNVVPLPRLIDVLSSGRGYYLIEKGVHPNKRIYNDWLMFENDFFKTVKPGANGKCFGVQMV